jgi:hypothetical protein
MLLRPREAAGNLSMTFELMDVDQSIYPFNTRLLCCLCVRNARRRIGRLESARVALFKNIYQFTLINRHFAELIRISSVGLHTKAYPQVSQGRGRDDVLVVHFEEVFLARFGFE